MTLKKELNIENKRARDSWLDQASHGGLGCRVSGRNKGPCL